MINLKSEIIPTWCPGCGDWGIGIAVKTAFSQLGWDPSSAMMMFDIGCSGNMNDFVNSYAMHTLHGRAITNGIGAKLANHKMPVVIIGGDGGLYGEGGNHILHAARGNHDITVIVHDNSVYGLTKGQVAPTALHGAKSNSTPSGIIEVPVNPLSLVLTQGATFIAQSFAGNVPHIISMIKAGIQHKGFSLVNILQPCVTYNTVNTYQYYLKNTYHLPLAHDPTNYEQALQVASELNKEHYPLGVVYDVARPAFHEQLEQLKENSLIEKNKTEAVSELVRQFE